MKIKVAFLVILAIMLGGAGIASAVTSTAGVTVTAEIVPTATLTLSNTTITFSGHESPPTPMAASENGSTVQATFRTATATPGTLVVQANGDLTNAASDTIPISALKSTATNTLGSFFAAGPITWSSSSAVQVGTGPSGDYTGTFSWALDNSWTYATGTYSATATYTLTAP